MENLNRNNKNQFDSNKKINSPLIEWKKWADKYFPVEEKIHNWEKDTQWVLK